MPTPDASAAYRSRSLNLRLYRQYTTMLWLVWMGATFDSEALVRWNRLRVMFA